MAEQTEVRSTAVAALGRTWPARSGDEPPVTVAVELSGKRPSLNSRRVEEAIDRASRPYGQSAATRSASGNSIGFINLRALPVATLQPFVLTRSATCSCCKGPPGF